MRCAQCGQEIVVSARCCPRAEAGAPVSLLTAGQQQERLRNARVKHGRSGYALAAGHAGVLTLFVPFLVPITLLLSLVALRHVRQNPTLEGRTRAIFGLCSCGIAVLVLLIYFVVREL